MKLFSHFSMELESKHSPAMAKDIYSKAIRNNESYRMKDKGVNKQQIVFATRDDSVIWHNSFLPVVELNFCDAESGTKIVANFRLSWSVKIMMYIYTAIALICELGLLYVCFQNELASPLLLLIPLGLALFALLLSYVGLRLSSRPVKEFLEYISP